MDLVKTFLEDWSSNKALDILENMKNGEKTKIYIWTVEKEGKYFKVNQKQFEGVWASFVRNPNSFRPISF